MPGTLLLHQAAYGLAGRMPEVSHGYLQTLLPLTVALGTAMAVGSLLPGLLLNRPRSGGSIETFALAGALIAVYAAQETTEAVVSGGGADALATSLAVGWSVPPLAFLLGAIASGFILWLGRVDDSLGRLRAARKQGPSERADPADRPPLRQPGKSLACAGLAFGAAQRPPPASA